MKRAALAVLMLLTLVGCGSGPTSPSSTEGSSPSETGPSNSDGVVPIGIRIPSLKIDSSAPWVPLGIQGQRGVKVTPPGEQGQIEVPDVKKPQQLGWFCPLKDPSCGAVLPGDVGPAVVLGHINGGGQQGIFAKLATIKPGAAIEIDRSDGRTASFMVTKVETPKKSAFPTNAVYGYTDKPELRLITCGGGPNGLVTIPGAGRSYVDQTIVFADLTGIKQTP